MTWFKVDDGLHSHPKALAAGTAALGLWVRCGSYCAQHLTEGFIPAAVANMYGSRSMSSALVSAGLFRKVEGGFQMHDFLDRNPSREEVERDRAAAAERQKRAREKARESREKSLRDSRRDESVSHASVTPAVTVPPTRPDPTRKEENGADAPAPTRSDVEGLCRYFLTALTRNEVKATITTRWRTDARLMLDRDKRDPSEIRSVIDWATADSFWRANIHSVPKLREKYDQLRLQMNKGSRQLPDGDNREYLREWS